MVQITAKSKYPFLEFSVQVSRPERSLITILFVFTLHLSSGGLFFLPEIAEAQDAQGQSDQIDQLERKEIADLAEELRSGNSAQRRAAETKLRQKLPSLDPVGAALVRTLLRAAEGTRPKIEQLISLYKYGNSREKEDAGVELVERAAEAIEPLLEELDDCSSEIAPVDNEEIKALIEKLRSEDRRVRVEAALKLRRLGRAAVELLMEAATDEDFKVRFWAITALGNIGDIRAKPVLIHALKDDHPSVRERAELFVKRLRWKV